MNSDVIDKWLQANAGADYPTLKLKAGGDVSKQQAALQYVCRKKAASKLPDLLKNKDFTFPTLLSAEQCTSETLARFHASLIESGATAVDMTTGLGIDSIYMSYRCKSLVSVEQNEQLAETFHHNVGVLGLKNIECITGDSISWLGHQQRKFDYIYIDPYRRDNEGGRVFALSQCSPDVTANFGLLLDHCNVLIVKASPMLDASAVVKDLHRHVSRILFTGTTRECKEMILICRDETVENPVIEAITLMQDESAISFQGVGKTCRSVDFKNPKTGGYIFEPYPAVMKTGLFDDFAGVFNVSPIAADTHLFVSQKEPVLPIAARSYKVDLILPFDRKSVRSIAARYDHLNVGVRNFPLKAPELERRIGLKPGGDYKLWGLTLADGKRCLVVGRAISQTYAP